MREMKESGIPGIGQIPASWQITKLYGLLSEHSDTYVSKRDGYLPLLSVSEYYGVADRKNKIGQDEFLTRADTLEGYKKCKKGDIISNIMLAWKGALGESPIDGIVSPAYCVYTPKKHVNSHYLQYLLRTKAYCDNYRVNSSGIIMSRLRLYSPQFLHLQTIQPPNTEQKAIADYLDVKCAYINALQQDLQAEIETLQAYKKSLITRAVTQGLDSHVEMKDSGVEWMGKINSNWKFCRLRYLLKEPLKYGASESGVDYSDALPRYIRITDIKDDNSLKEAGKLSLTFEQAKGYLLKEDTILFARSGATVGKTFLYKPEYGLAAFAGYLISAVPDSQKLLAKWLYYYTNSGIYWNCEC